MAVRLEIHCRNVEPRKEALKHWRIPASERTGLLRFLDELALGRVNKGRRISESRQLKYLDILKAPLEFFSKPVPRLTLKDIERFEKALNAGTLKSSKGAPYAHATKVDMRRALQIYTRWRIGAPRSERLTGWFDTRDMGKTPDFLREQEVEKLYKACKSPHERFLIAILFDSGARATELHNIRYEDIQLPEGVNNHPKITLKEEYSKTKGRNVPLFWKYSLEALKEYLAMRLADGMKSSDPVFTNSYAATRMFLNRLGKRVLGRSIHYHLFRHSSATYYADKMNRQQLCIRYGWGFSSRMPDVYIARAGVDSQELEQKFTATRVETLQQELVKEREDSKMKTARIQFLEQKMDSMEERIHLIAQALAERPSIEQVRAELRARQVANVGS
jgi:integrase